VQAICIYCGSNEGNRRDYRDAAAALGQALARRRLTLVYGGGCVGLMGAVADACMAARGRVVGVIPRALLEREVGHRGVSELRVVDSMHERKQLMAELADGFVALPGGIGTLEELFEMWTWAQLGLHRKPVGLLNAGGYFDALLEFLDRSVKSGFIRPKHRAILQVAHDAETLLERFELYEPPDVPKWIGKAET
jgi:uncharacterized protein (TIGR00730 family)